MYARHTISYVMRLVQSSASRFARNVLFAVSRARLWTTAFHVADGVLAIVAESFRSISGPKLYRAT